MSKKRVNSQELVENAKKYIKYKKDKKNKIAYLTLDRPERMNAPGSGMRRLYAEYLAKANIDDDVKVVVIRASGNDFGTGADISQEELGNQFGLEEVSLLYEFGIDDEDVTYPPHDTFRHLGQMADFFSTARSGNRPLQEFKKISIVEAKGYCYGWHFYQAADADLLICSDDTLFGHAAFRYAGWGPRMWTWIERMGLRQFSEMLFTGRPFTGQEMKEIGFVNRVVPRDQLEAETEKFAMACSRTRPTDTVVVQKTFMELYKQHRGEYMGSVLTGMIEGMTRYMKPDSKGDVDLDADAMASGINNVVKDFDMQYPPDMRLSRGNRRKP
jgi:enoyl-CoA hydratase/carnithine racemase